MSLPHNTQADNNSDVDRATTPWEITTRCPKSGMNLPLHLPHLLELQKGSGLSAQTILENGIYSTWDCEKVKGMLNWKQFFKKNLPVLVFRYFDRSGREVFSRVKPNGTIELGGKPAKYLSPSGSGVGVYFPARLRSQMDDPSVSLFITEGEKKSLKATQEGFPCIGLGGVACWHTKGSKALHPELRNVAWQDRDACIVFDSDAVENDMVRNNEMKLAMALEKKGANVRIVRLPPGDDGAKVGLDDYLVKHGVEAFRKLVDNAETTNISRTAVATQREHHKTPTDKKNFNPREEAMRFLNSTSYQQKYTWRFYRGEFWIWNRGSYKPIDEDEVEPRLLNFLCEHNKDVTSRDVREVITHMKSLSLIPSDRDPPFWIDFAEGLESLPAEEVLCIGEEIVHVRSLVHRKKPHRWKATPAIFSVSSLPFDFNVEAPAPEAWLAFLKSIWPDDTESIETLQEIFGYLLMTDTSQHKIFLLVGPPRSGKGTIIRVLNKIVGPRNVAAPTLSSLATNFGLWPLVDRSVATINDARLSGRADLVVIVERLLSISGEDSLTIDRKYRTPITCKLPTRFILATNELPRLTDASAAIASRVILLQMHKSFLGQEDRSLDDRLSKELSGILLWAIKGWQRLNERGYFVQPRASEESLEELRDLASPMSAFVRDCCEVGPGCSAPVDELFENWKRWAESQGRGRYVGTKPNFSRELRAAAPGVRTRRPTIGGARVRVFEGIKCHTPPPGPL